jgi:hypothetical protein
MHHHRGLLLLSFSLASLLWLTVRQSLDRGEGLISSAFITTRTFDGVRVRLLSEPGAPESVQLKPARVDIVVAGRPNILNRMVEGDLEAHVELAGGNSVGKRHPVRVHHQVAGARVVSVQPQEVLIAPVESDSTGGTGSE